MQSSENTLPVLDPNTIDALVAALENEVFELFDEFVTDVQLELESLHEMAKSQRWQEMAMVTHTIKGCGGNLGASSFAAACQVLEDTVKAEQGQDLDGLIHSVETEFQKAKEAMQKISSGR
ncbi:MAG: Hpt domain-containing protein [Gammaproteobacteria bacterium]|nr:Hpt domain-containing protein [Gammaproteobacteria bacterium]MDH5801208.1 Hpt domain-containing protein [Gammaproteobacteria bacterium]